MARARRRRRGAAMVEAVVAIPFFIIIFSSMLYIVHLYGEKQRTLREAKQSAWSYALSNCEKSDGKAVTEDEKDNAQNAANGQGCPTCTPGQNNPSQVGQYASQAGGSEYTKDWGTAKVTVTGSVRASNLIGGYENSLSTTTRMQCNEKPHEGNVLGVLKTAWGLFANF